MTALVMLSACETVEPQQGIVSGAVVEETVANDIITATIGADTKTYLEWDWVSEVYKTRWSADDYIWLIEDRSDSLKYQTCNLLEGAGTSSAKFPANLKADSYYAVYSSNAYFNGGVLSVELYDNQYHWSYGDSEHKDFLNHAYPMVAKSSTTSFEFENLCSVLKLSVTGHGERLDVISVKSNDESEVLSGIGTMYFDGDAPRMEMDQGGYTYVNYNVECVLDETPLDCYIVLPSQTYEAGFTIELHTDEGIMDLTTGQNIVLEQSKLHEVPVIAYETEISTLEPWYVVDNYTGESYAMDYEAGWYVLKSCGLSENSRLIFQNENGDIYALSSEYDEIYYCPNNTSFNLQFNGGQYIIPIGGGTWDLYFNPNTAKAYLMWEGYGLDTVPTHEDVFRSSFDSLWNVGDGSMVMASGIVLATYERGFILGMSYTYENAVLVYQGPDSDFMPTIGSWVDIYAEKTTYRNIPELKSVQWHFTWVDQIHDYGSSTQLIDLTNSSDFLNFWSERYDYVVYKGVLSYDGNRYYVDVAGAEGRRAVIEYPSQDLTEYIGEWVLVGGYFIGFNDSDELLFTVLHQISIDDACGGSTEDFFPGGDIVVTRRKIELTK